MITGHLVFQYQMIATWVGSGPSGVDAHKTSLFFISVVQYNSLTTDVKVRKV